jgi:hypothetical protein
VRKREDDQMRRFAAVGAEQRLGQIAQEAERIYRAFPELRRPSSPGSAGVSTTRSIRAGRRRRRKMSAEARRRISEAQKARWAKQKAKTQSADHAGRPKKR